MAITPIRKEHTVLGSAPVTALNDELYGRRMQLILSTGAGKWLDIDPNSMVAAAMSGLSDEDMVDQVLGAVDQVQFNEMKKRMEAMPSQMQAGEFNGLTPKVQRLLRGAGYQLPQEKDPKGLLHRMFTWDIPLLPEEHFGTAVKVGMAPIRFMGSIAGFAASNVWENAVMKPSRFATRTGRMLAYREQAILADEFANPPTWSEAWEAARLDDGSYYKITTNAAIDKVGGENTKILKIWIREGPQGVYDYFEKMASQRGAGQEEITQLYKNWYESLIDDDMGDALEILESGRLTLPDASVKAWNHHTPFDVRPGTKPATVIGLTGSLATEILLDPVTWVGGFYTKILKAARAGVRGGQSVNTIDLWRRIALAERAMTSEYWGKLKILNEATGETVNAAAEVRKWIDGGGWRTIGATNINVRAQARAINKLTDRVNDAMAEVDVIDAFKDALKAADPQTVDGLVAIRNQTGRALDAPISDYELRILTKEKYGKGTKADLLVRDLPALGHVWDDMIRFHRARRDGHWWAETVDEATGGVTKVHRSPQSGPITDVETTIPANKPFPTLADEQGYWDFMADDTGWNALASKLGGVDPEAMWIPKIGKFGSGWMGTKRYMREILDFDKFPVEIKADMARMTSQYLAKQTNYVHTRIMDDIKSGALGLSDKGKVLDSDGLYRILDEPSLDVATSNKAVGDIADTLNIEAGDVMKIEEARVLHQKNASQVILEDSELSDLLHWYQHNGYEVRGGELILSDTRDWFNPFVGAKKAAQNAYKNKIHTPGSMNAELTWAEQMGAIGSGAAAGLFYYPARLAEKFTTYIPRNGFLDNVTNERALSEFTGLIDMGIMSGMSRTQIDNYLRTFMLGNESERWLVQNEFFMDFIGRSGALVHGGRDVQEFIQRFIRYGHQRYANIADDAIGVNGLNVRRAIVPGTEHGAQLATANVIPNYRELAALTRYMGFYRWAGWGIHLPAVDKFLARTWRPAVLLRLGYVARNGGEELMSWWLREGPRQWANQKVAKSALSKHIVWDEYGRKMLKTIGENEQLPLIWRPFSRLWRSFNEVAGWGDYAISRKALRESIQTNSRWRFVSEDQRKVIFDSTRELVKGRVESTLVGATSRRLFELAEAQAQRLSHVFHMTGQAMGIPTKQHIAKWVGKSVLRDKRHDQRVDVIAKAMTNTTILDAQMKDILGTFDTYLNFEKNTMDTVLRQGGFGAPVYSNLKLPMDYGATEFKWVTNAPGTDIYAVDKSIAVAQRLHYMSEDPAHRAYLHQLGHYSSAQQEQVFGELAVVLGLPVAENESAAAAVLRFFQSNHSSPLRDLADAFDTGSVLRLMDREGVDKAVKQLTAIDEFVEAMPPEIQDIVRAFLEPVAATGQNPNHIAFLVNNLDPALISTNLDVVRQRAKLDFINQMLTPEGQQLLRSTHRSNVGFDALGGKISDPLPEGATRLFVPMISVEHIESLVAVLSSRQAADWFEDFVTILTREFETIGLSAADARKAANLLQPTHHPDSLHHTPNLYVDLAEAWSKGQGGNDYFPLLTVSSNDGAATAISKSLDEMFGATRPRARIGSIDVNSEELWNAAGSAAASRPVGPNISTVRAGIRQTFQHQDMATRGDIDYINQFYGWGPEGARAAVDFGSRGLKNERVFGMAGTMLFPKVDGVMPVQMIDDMPVTHRVRVYRHRKDGRTAVLRAGDERPAHWYSEEEWQLIDEQIVTHNDLRNAAEELALINAVEIDDLLTSSGRVLAGQEEVFHPWIREVLKVGEISQDRIVTHANNAAWWDKAPDRLLALLPVTEEGATRIEKLDKAWNTLLRNWFDGVVNPMIGAMVREPLFQHYLLVAMEQTAGVRRLHHHSKGAYDDLVRVLGPSAKVDDEGQVLIDGLEGFIEMDWANAPMSPDELISKVGFSIEHRSAAGFHRAVSAVLDGDEVLSAETRKVFEALQRAAEMDDPTQINQFFDWAIRSKRQFEVHRDVSLRRAMTLTGSYIDDHRIRSQFQQMVGTAIPFWFAEDQFLRRMGRSLKHNPMMFRNLHLTMNAGVYSGLVQEDQFGEKRLVIPGSEPATTFMLEIAEEFPIVNRVFGGPLGFVTRAGLSNGISMNIHVVPGYDLDQIGRMGVGPLLAVPINLAAHRDPSIRKDYEHHLVGGRYSGASKLIESSSDFGGLLTETIWSSVLPAVLTRPLQVFGMDGGAARTKATIDVLKFMAMNDMLPTEQEIASAVNPRLFQEQFMDRVDAMARQYQLLQALTWFVGPATGSLSDLVHHENWEWQEEFHGLLDAGISWEEAYPIWVKRIRDREGEFNPMQFSPFRTATTQKIPYAVLEATQEANVWLTDHDEFIRNFIMSAPFFMPRKLDVEDTEYVAEAKQRQINMGLLTERSPSAFLEELYANAAEGTYHRMREDYTKKRYAIRANNGDTTTVDRQWEAFISAYHQRHPAFAYRMTTSISEERREKTVQEFRILVNNQDLVPDGEHRTDVLLAMATIINFYDAIDVLTGRQTRTATDKRDALKLMYWRGMEEFVRGRPWLNEIYYSVFLPMIGDSWMAKYDAGLIDVSGVALAM